MIYATEQQVVVTAGIVVIVAAVSFALGAWWMSWRTRKELEEEERWEREQARARRTHPVYWQPPEITHEAWPYEDARVACEEYRAHEDQALTLANDESVHEWHDHPPLKWGDEGVPGCPSCEARWETVLQPTAVFSPEEMSWTGEFRLRLEEFERDMAVLIGGTDERLRSITR